MDKERRREDIGDKFKNEFVENSLENEFNPPKQPPSGELTSDESEENQMEWIRKPFLKKDFLFKRHLTNITYKE